MKYGYAKQTLVAVAVLLLAGAMMALAETRRLEVKVEKGDSETIHLNVDGEAKTIELDDLADGEERVFEAGEHKIMVRRAGDELHVTLDGEAMHGLNLLSGTGGANMLWVGEDGATTELKGKKVIVVTGEGESDGHKVIKIRCESHDGGDVDCEELEAIDIDSLVADGLDAKEVHVSGAPMVIKHQVMGSGKAMVHFSCSEDGTKLAIPKGKATQERYLCPVCGREMAKVEQPEMKIMTFIEQEESHETKED